MQQLSSFTGSLPCSVPEKDQLDQGVCEMNQAVLGYAGDAQPVVQNVQVHAVGGASSRRPTRISATLVSVTQLGRSDEEHWRLGGTASRCDHRAGREKNIRATQAESSPSELLFIQIKGPVPRTTHPLLLKAQPLFKWLARAADARAVISGLAGGELETDEGKDVAKGGGN